MRTAIRNDVPDLSRPLSPHSMRLLALVLSLALAAPVLAQPAPDDPTTWDQTAQGVRLLGGSASLIRFSSTTSANASPRVGAFVVDGLALSAQLQLGYSRSGLDDETGSSTQLGIGPSVTYYFVRQGATPRPFVEGDLSMTYYRVDRETSDGDSDWTIGAGVAAGVAVPVARNVALRAQAFYRTLDFEFSDDSYYGLSAGFTTFIY